MVEVMLKEKSGIRLADRMSRLGTETAFEVLARAKQLETRGRSIIHLEIGEPDFDTPANITEAAVTALRKGYTHYGPSAGLPEVKEGVAQYISQTRKVKVNPEQVVITPGGKPIIFFAILALIDSSDEVLYPNPGFPIYESVIRFVGARAVPIPLREENQFRLDVNELEDMITNRTRMLILNSPHNPTGSVLTRQDLEDIYQLVRERDLVIFSDEIYSRILYEGEHCSLYSFPGMDEKMVLMDGMSKTYAMTGWRLGYGVMPVDLAAQVARLMTNSNSCTATFSQKAMQAALAGSQDSVTAMVREFKRRRDVIVEGLNQIPRISCQMPNGAFYVFPNVTKLGWNSRKLADYLLEQAGVAVLSGTAFGELGEGYLRFSYANSVEKIQEGLNRVQKALEKI